MSKNTRRAAGLAVLSLLAAAAPVAAHSPGKDDRDRRAIGGPAVKQANGLWKVRLEDGSEVFTHGADMAADMGADHGQEIGPGDPERAPACATDASAIHVMYGRPAGTPERADAKTQILSAIRRMNAVLNESSLASGGPTADFEVLCTGGQLRIDTFTNAGSGSFTDVTGAAMRSFSGKNKLPRGADHLIFYDGPPAEADVCGLGTVYNDETPGATNLNNTRDAYAINYAGCWDGRTPMHENGHNQGAVQINAPNSTGTGHHCIEDFDVMCYTPDGGDRNQTKPLTALVPACLTAMVYDCGADTYFDSAPEAGEWLATHWNIGSTANRFIRFGG